MSAAESAPRARPRASMLLLAFNQESTVESAARSCCAQSGEPLEIVLSDDASTDATFSILTRLAAEYRGPHSIVLRRNERNLGIGAHYNAAIAASSGDLLITAAGDDISMPDRAQSLLAAWAEAGCRPDLISSHVVDMDESGVDHGVLTVADLSATRSAQAWMQRRPHVIGAAHAFTRRMHERFGPLDAGVAFEDQCMALRAACGGGGITVPRALVRYRRGGLTARRGAIADGAAFLRWSRRRFQRQQALCRQVQRDLRTAGEEPHWGGKPARDARRADLALSMLDVPTRWRRLRMGLAPAGAGLHWSLRTALDFAFPGIASALRRALRRDAP